MFTNHHASGRMPQWTEETTIEGFCNSHEPDVHRSSVLHCVKYGGGSVMVCIYSVAINKSYNGTFAYSYHVDFDLKVNKKQEKPWL